MLDTESYKKFINLSARKKELKSLTNQVQKKMDELEKPLLDQLLLNGLDKLSMDGRTCYPKNTTVAKISNKATAITILKQGGFEDYISEGYNANSISKLVRDQIEEFGELPPEFGEVIQPLTVTRLCVNGG